MKYRGYVVKISTNYRKVQTASDGKFYEVLADSKNIMVKEITEDDSADLCKRMKEEAVYNTLNEEEKKAIRDVSVEQLLSWRVIGERNGKYYPNNAYAILTGDYRVPNTIQCGVFKGSTKAIFVDRKEYIGPAWELVEEAFQYVLRNIRMGAIFKGVFLYETDGKVGKRNSESCSRSM